MILILSKAPTLGEEKGLEASKLSFGLAESISRAHTMHSKLIFTESKT